MKPTKIDKVRGSDIPLAEEGSATQEKPRSNARAADMQRGSTIEQFYDQVAVKRFAEQAGQMLPRARFESAMGKERTDELSRRGSDFEGSGDTAAASPLKLYRAWSARTFKEAPVDDVKQPDVFASWIDEAKATLQNARKQGGPLQIGGKLIPRGNIAAALERYCPSLPLAKKFAEHAEFGGTEILAAELKSLGLPEDVMTSLKLELSTIAEVKPSTEAQVSGVVQPEAFSSSFVNWWPPRSHDPRAFDESRTLAELRETKQLQVKPSLIADALVVPTLPRAMQGSVIEYLASLPDGLGAGLRGAKVNPDSRATMLWKVRNNSQAIADYFNRDSGEGYQYIYSSVLNPNVRRKILSMLKLETRAAMMIQSTMGEVLELPKVEANGLYGAIPYCVMAFSRPTLSSVLEGTIDDKMVFGSSKLWALITQGSSMEDIARELAGMYPPPEEEAPKPTNGLDKRLLELAQSGMRIDEVEVGWLSDPRPQLREGLRETEFVYLLPMQLRENVLANPMVDVQSRLEKAATDNDPHLFRALVQLKQLNDSRIAIAYERIFAEALSTVRALPTDLRRRQFALRLISTVTLIEGPNIPSTVLRAIQDLAALSEPEALPIAALSNDENLQRVLTLASQLNLRALAVAERVSLPSDGMSKLIENITDAVTAAGASAASVSYGYLALRLALERRVPFESYKRLLSTLITQAEAPEIYSLLYALNRAGISTSEAATLVKDTAKQLAKTKNVDASLVFLAAVEQLASEGSAFAPDALVDALRSVFGPNKGTWWRSDVSRVAERWILDGELFAKISDEQKQLVLEVACDGLTENAVDIVRAVSEARLAGAKIKVPAEWLKKVLCLVAGDDRRANEFPLLLSEGAKALSLDPEVLASEIFHEVEKICERDLKGVRATPDKTAIWEPGWLLAVQMRALSAMSNPDEELVKQVLHRGLSLDVAESKTFFPYISCLQLATRCQSLSRILIELAVTWVGIEAQGDKEGYWGIDYAEKLFLKADSADELMGQLSEAIAKVAEKEMAKEANDKSYRSPFLEKGMVRQHLISMAMRECESHLEHVAEGRPNPERATSLIIQSAKQFRIKGMDVPLSLLAKIRTKVRNTRPDLDDVDLVYGVAVQSTANVISSAAKPAVATKSVLGMDAPVFQGERAFYLPQQKQMAPMPTWTKNARKLLKRAIVNERPVFVFGSTSTAKTSTAQYLGVELGFPPVRVPADRFASKQDLYGKLKLDSDGRPFLEPSPAVKAFERGGVIIFDEANANSPEFMLELAAFVRAYKEGELKLTFEGKAVSVKRHPSCRIILTGNPGYPGTNDLPPELREEVEIEYFDKIPEAELVFLLGTQFADIPPELAKAVVDFQSRLEDPALGLKEPYPNTIRTLVDWAQSFSKYRGGSLSDAQLAARECREIYYDCIVNPEDRKKIAELFEKTFGMKVEATYPPEEFYELNVGPHSARFGDVAFVPGPNAVKAFDDLAVTITNTHFPIVATLQFKRALYHLIKRYELQQAPLLIGRADTMKLALIKSLAQLLGKQNQAVVRDFTPETLEQELIGQDWVSKDDNGRWQTSFAKGLVAELCESGGVFGARHLENAEPNLLTRFYSLLEGKDRQLALPNGETLEVRPDFIFVGSYTVKNGQSMGASLAFLSRMRPLYVEPPNAETNTEILQKMAERLGVPSALAKEIGKLIVNFDASYHELLRKGLIAARDEKTCNLPNAGFEMMTNLLTDLCQASKQGAVQSDDLKREFLSCVDTYYALPSPYDRARLAKLAVGLFDGNQQVAAEAMK